MFEWCQDSWNASNPANKSIDNDVLIIVDSLVEENPRILRGGQFYNEPMGVRSAIRYGISPASRDNGNGFRPSRTYH